MGGGDGVRLSITASTRHPGGLASAPKASSWPSPATKTQPYQNRQTTVRPLAVSL